MNTTRLKPFAQQARKILLDGVRARMLFWGFDEKKGVIEIPEEIPGGVLFRGEVLNDASIYKKWIRLKSQVEHHSFKDVIEEASYTWFNRLMAIKILEKNGYENLTIGLSGTNPAILQNALGGLMPNLSNYDKGRVQQFLLEGKEEEAFGVLLLGFCRQNSLLKRVFGGIDDFTELLLPNNLLSTGNIIDLINKNGFIEESDYKEVELIGWLYQFYISDRKDEVFKGFKANKKARKEDIPAATQIFTPKWIVKYLVENTVGTTWLEHYPDSKIKETLKYFVESKSEKQQGPKKPISATEITLLDPAVGSGHILVTAFDLYMQMYKEEGFTTRQAVREALKNNLFGLDIDKRATQLARFAVLMKAAKYDVDFLNEDMIPHIYPMPEPFFFDKAMIEDFFSSTFQLEGDLIEKESRVNKSILKDEEILIEFPESPDVIKLRAVNELTKALVLMLQAQNLGSTMIFDLSETTTKYIRLSYNAFSNLAKSGKLNLEQQSWWNSLRNYLDPLILLTSKYNCVVANPPYMSQKSMNPELKEYVNTHYPKTKHDLFSVFIEKMISQYTLEDGKMGCITMESWMFLSSYESLRKYLIENFTIKSLTHFGWHIIGIAFGTAQMIIENKPCKSDIGEYSYFEMQHLDVSSNTPIKFPVRTNRYRLKSQFDFKKLPGYAIAYWISEEYLNLFGSNKSIGDISISDGKTVTGNNELFVRNIWEVSSKNIGGNSKWKLYTKGGAFRRWYGNIENVINWSAEAREFYRKDKVSRIIPEYLWNKEGVSWNWVTSGLPSFRKLDSDVMFDAGAPTIFFNDDKYIAPTLSLLNSNISKELLEILNPTVNLPPRYVQSIPWIFKPSEPAIKVITNLVNDCIRISQIDWNNRELSWNFERSPLVCESINLQEAVSLYQSKSSILFFELLEKEEKLNKILIDLYNLNEIIDSKVEIDDITILQNELDINLTKQQINYFDAPKVALRTNVLIQQLISYAIGCFMGRYRLDSQGLQIAYPRNKTEELLSYEYNNLNFRIDEDAIIPLMGINSPFNNNIVNRFKEFLQIVWGEASLTDNINYVNSILDIDIEKFLIEKFWDFHKKMYQKKPIYWLFTSPEGSFKVLTYMHRMDKFTVQKIRLNYLMRNIDFLRDKIQQAEANNKQGRDVDKLRNALKDCLDYDKILKPLADQQITFDLDDGVAVNYEKFKDAVAPLK